MIVIKRCKSMTLTYNNAEIKESHIQTFGFQYIR